MTQRAQTSRQRRVLTPPQQPISPQPMPLPTPASNLRPIGCPQGLEYLLYVDQLLVKQKVELLEVLTGFETNNQYDIQNNLGQNIYLASENTDCCTRCCCGPNRAFEMRIMAANQQEVMHLTRPLRCDNCYCFCCLQYVRVESPPGQLIGHVEQQWSCLRPAYRVIDANGEVILKILGPFCTFSIFCQDVEFQVVSKNGDIKVGRITKQWSGILKETFTDADIFGVVFPLDMDVKAKACLLAATILIDYMFFEKKGNDEKDRPGMMDTRW
ncbi:phospholipid scramblase 1-like [Oppia nitens]|uniref:phospholipid scramblase 1-like n=1 Tax=Oppia nitens TaxID=1686743 RepID=UPI0023DCAAE0|nr:phospholipid scramblase 1-like [Oppia nitens]